MDRLALVTARGGSVGLPGKNLRPLGGQPLIAWTVAAAVESRIFDRVVVSTDSQEIAESAKAAGAQVPFMRPAALATSEASSTDVIGHALETLGFEGMFALLQPTSPFRSADHIESAVALCSAGAAAVVSVTKAKPAQWLLKQDVEKNLVRAFPDLAQATRRQDADETMQPNGAIYVASTDFFAAHGGFLGPGTRGFEMGLIDSIDIDDAEDFALAEAVVTAGLRGFPG